MRMAGLVAAAILMVICALYYFLMLFLSYYIPERAAQSKSSMIVVSFALIHFRMLEMHSRCVCSREAHSEHILYSSDFGHDDVG